MGEEKMEVVRMDFTLYSFYSRSRFK